MGEAAQGADFGHLRGGVGGVGRLSRLVGGDRGLDDADDAVGGQDVIDHR